MSSAKPSVKKASSAPRPLRIARAADTLRGEKTVTAPLAADALQQATLTWQHFYDYLDETDKLVLDRAAAGHKLKVVCYEQDVSYDTLQKRFKRWQAQLGLPSLNTLLYVWRVVRADQTQTADDEPPLMRHAPEVALETALRAQPGYKEVELPQALRANARARDALASRALREQEESTALVQCLLSPALWLSLLDLGQGVGAPALDATHVPLQHQLFLSMLALDADDKAQPTNNAIAAYDEHTKIIAHAYAPMHAPARANLRTTRVNPAMNAWLAKLGADDLLSFRRPPLVGLASTPLAITARRLGALPGFDFSPVETDLKQMTSPQIRRHWEQHEARYSHPAFSGHNDIAFWQRLIAFAKDANKLRELVRTITLDQVLAPLTGMAIAMLATTARFESLQTELSGVYQAIVLARRRHAQLLGIHPVRLLHYFALRSAGVAAPASMVQLAAEGLAVDANAAVQTAVREGAASPSFPIQPRVPSSLKVYERHSLQ